jgi:hypothetical protein
MNSAKNIINGFSSSKQFEAEMKRASQTNNRLTAADAAVPTVGSTMTPTAVPVPLRNGMVARPTVPIYNSPHRIPIAVPIRPRTSRWSGGKQKTKKKHNKRNKRKKTMRKKHKKYINIRKTHKSTRKTMRKKKRFVNKCEKELRYLIKGKSKENPTE